MRQDDNYWVQVAPIWDKVSVHSSPEMFLHQFAAVMPAQGNLYAAHWCYSEVCNGGLHQFFTNPTGVLAPEAAAGFRAINMPACGKIIDNAMGFFGLPYPPGNQDRYHMLADVSGDTRREWDPFHVLDDELSELMETESGGFVAAADAYAARLRDQV